MRLFNEYHRRRAAQRGLRLASIAAIGRSSVLEAASARLRIARRRLVAVPAQTLP